MKNLIIVFVVLISSPTSVFAKSNSTEQGRAYIDTTPAYLKSLNLAQFANKPIDLLIAKLPPNYVRMYVRGRGRDDIAGILSIHC